MQLTEIGRGLTILKTRKEKKKKLISRFEKKQNK